MAEGDAPAAAPAVVTASPRSPMPPETPSTLKRRQRGLVSRVWKGIFGGREDVEKLLQALSKEEEAVRARLRRRARASRNSAHNILALAAALEVIPFVSFRLKQVSAVQLAVIVRSRGIQIPLFSGIDMISYGRIKDCLPTPTCLGKKAMLLLSLLNQGLFDHPSRMSVTLLCNMCCRNYAFCHFFRCS